MAKLTGAQLERLHNGFLAAFPNRESLETMLRFGMDVSLGEITAQGSLGSVVFELLRWSEAQGRIRELAKAARERVPGNSALKEAVAAIWPEGDSGGGTVAGQPESPMPAAANPALLQGPPKGVTYPGRVKLSVTQKVVNDWRTLATYLDVPAHDMAGFRQGAEASALWDWLEVRNRLDELEGALRANGFPTLADELVKNRR